MHNTTTITSHYKQNSHFAQKQHQKHNKMHKQILQNY